MAAAKKFEVRILVPVNVFHEGRFLDQGEAVHVPEEFAEAWVAAMVAEYVGESPKADKSDKPDQIK